MKAKEKAKELVMKFQYLVDGWDCYHDEPIELMHRLSPMKKCALICVDEILESHYKVLVGVMPKTYDYWTEVQQEINKL